MAVLDVFFIELVDSRGSWQGSCGEGGDELERV